MLVCEEFLRDGVLDHGLAECDVGRHPLVRREDFGRARGVYRQDAVIVLAEHRLDLGVVFFRRLHGYARGREDVYAGGRPPRRGVRTASV